MKKFKTLCDNEAQLQLFQETQGSTASTTLIDYINHSSAETAKIFSFQAEKKARISEEDSRITKRILSLLDF